MRRTLAILLSIATIALLSACGQPGAAPAGSADASPFTLLLTDAPASEASWLRVDFGRIDLVPAEGSGGGVVTVSEDGGTIENLLELRNGATVALVEDLPIPDGSYRQIRLIVEAATIGFGEGDDEVVHDVTVPSGAQSGLKIGVEPALLARAGATSRIVLDFDASTAVVEAPPGSGNYILKPTGVRAVTASGVLEGAVVAGGSPLRGATVNVYEGAWSEGATPLVGSVSEADGGFRFITLTEGTYDVEVVADGYAPALLGGVEVRAGEATALGEIALEPLVP